MADVKTYGTLLQTGDTADYATTTTWTSLSVVKSIKPPKKSRKEIDTTHLLSANEYGESIAGIGAGGELEANLKMNPTQAGTLSGYVDGGAIHAIRILYPDGSGWKFNGWFMEEGDEEITDSDIVRSGVKIKVTGKPVRAVGMS